MKGRMEGLTTLIQTLLMGIPSCWRVFGGRAHFSASLLLLAFANNVSLLNPYLDLACAGEGVHALYDPPGHGRTVGGRTPTSWRNS